MRPAWSRSEGSSDSALLYAIGPNGLWPTGVAFSRETACSFYIRNRNKNNASLATHRTVQMGLMVHGNNGGFPDRRFPTKPINKTIFGAQYGGYDLIYDEWADVAKEIP